MTDLNPLAWPAETFLVGYALAIIAIAFLLRARRAMTGDGPDASLPIILKPLEYAFLWRGEQHTADTVLLGLMHAGAARLAQADVIAREHASVDTKAGELPQWLLPFRTIPRARMTRAALRGQIAPQLAALRQDLARRGLIPPAPSIATLRRDTALMMAALLLVGIVRLQREPERDLMYAMLAYMMVFVAVAGLLSMLYPPTRTSAGLAAMARTRSAQSRAARAPVGEEIVLAFAMNGQDVLSGTPYQDFGRHIRVDGDTQPGGSRCNVPGGGGCSGYKWKQ